MSAKREELRPGLLCLAIGWFLFRDAGEGTRAPSRTGARGAGSWV